MTRKAPDGHGRWRSVTVGFRVSPEEAQLIDAQVAMSGQTKQEYLVNRALVRDVVVMPNSRVQRAMRLEGERIYQELRRIRKGSEIGPELEARIEVFADQFAALGMDVREGSAVDMEDAAIHALKRRPNNVNEEKEGS